MNPTWDEQHFVWCPACGTVGSGTLRPAKTMATQHIKACDVPGVGVYHGDTLLLVHLAGMSLEAVRLWPLLADTSRPAEDIWRCEVEEEE